MEKQEEDESLIPMFITELILTVQSLLFKPSLEDFLVCVSSDSIRAYIPFWKMKQLFRCQMIGRIAVVTPLK